MDLEDRVADALAQAAADDQLDGPAMITGWTLIVEYLDADGDDCSGYFSSDSMTASRELGLLQSGVIRVTETLRRWFEPD